MPLQGPFKTQVIPDTHRMSEFHTSSPASRTAPAAAGLFGGRVGTAAGLPGLPLYGHEAPETSVRTQQLLEALAARAGLSMHGPISLVPGWRKGRLGVMVPRGPEGDWCSIVLMLWEYGRVCVPFKDHNPITYVVCFTGTLQTPKLPQGSSPIQEKVLQGRGLR